MSDRLVVFVKAPRPGEVKTRLAASIGAVRAAELYRVMAERVFRETAPSPGAPARVFFYSPPEAHREIEEWLPGERCLAQSGRDLGARMSAAFQWAFDGGASRVVLIGTDVPELSRADIALAFEGLRGSEVVIGPALDGGYYLIGTTQPVPALFDGIPWSTPSVLGQTLARAESIGLRVAPLPVRVDVDTFDDLRREWPRLRRWLPGDLVQEIGAALMA